MLESKLRSNSRFHVTNLSSISYGVSTKNVISDNYLKISNFWRKCCWTFSANILLFPIYAGFCGCLCRLYIWRLKAVVKSALLCLANHTVVKSCYRAVKQGGLWLYTLFALWQAMHRACAVYDNQQDGWSDFSIQGWFSKHYHPQIFLFSTPLSWGSRGSELSRRPPRLDQKFARPVIWLFVKSLSVSNYFLCI